MCNEREAASDELLKIRELWGRLQALYEGAFDALLEIRKSPGPKTGSRILLRILEAEAEARGFY